MSSTGDQGRTPANRDVLFAKVAQLELHLTRIRGHNTVSFEGFVSDRRLQDILLFNLMQAVENGVQIAALVLREEQWDEPELEAERFLVLCEQGVIDADLADRMVRAVALCDTILYHLPTLDWEAAYAALTRDVDDLERFATVVLERYGGNMR